MPENNDDIRDKLAKICGDVLGEEPENVLANRTKPFGQSGADSLDVIEILTDAEDEFDVVLSTAKADAIGNFDDLLSSLTEEINAKKTQEKGE